MTTTTSVTSGPRRGLFDTLEIDRRLFGMIGAFVLMCVAFHYFSGYKFLTPRNIFTITVQTVSVGIMATGMVFVIVARHIDLSVGSMLAMCSAVMAMTQAQWLPPLLGLGHPLILPLTIIVGLAVGTSIGALSGWLIGYQGIPSFIVTLGGLLIWRNVNWYATNGQSVALTDPLVLAFGGTEGVLGTTLSWIVGVAMALGVVWAILSSRRNRKSHGFQVKPLWAEATLIAIVVGAIMGFVAVLNAYPIPEAKLQRLFEARGEVLPPGYTAFHGLPISALMLIVVVVIMTIIAQKTRLGRYIFAMGGNPDAASLSGIDTRKLTLKIFALLGFLCGLAALVAQARLQSHGNDIGTLDELKVIAAAVIGGTALAGGVGTIYGAILGALMMQSLQSGMAMFQVQTSFQNIVVGLVLVVAVWLDIIYRKRLGVK